MELIIFLAFVILFIAARSAHTKISNLEKRVDVLTQQQSSDRTRSQSSTVVSPPEVDQESDIYESQAGSVAAPAPIPMPMYQPPATTSPRPFQLQPTEPESFFLYEWFKDHTLIKIGSIIFFLGAAWFVTYAFDQNWVSPIVRVMMGLLLALVFYGVGAIRESIAKTQYIVLTALGSAVVFVSVLAAQFSFALPLLPAAVSLLILTLAITYTVYAALRTNTEWLAVTAAVAALLSPQFTGGEVASVVPLFTYLFFISAGLGFVVLFTAWRFVSLTMVIGVSWYALLASEAQSQLTLTWLFVMSFAALFLALTSVSIIRNRVPLFTDGMVLLITGLLYTYFVHIAAAVPALAMFAGTLVVAAVGYLARMCAVEPNAVLLYAVCSVVGIFTGTAYLFDGVTATFFFAIEAAALVFFAMRFAFLQKTIYLATVTFTLPVVMGLVAMFSNQWETGLIHSALLSVSTVCLCLGAIGLYMYQVSERSELLWLKALASTLLAIWYGYTVVMLIVVARSVALVTDTNAAHWATVFLLGLSVLLTFVSLLKVQSFELRGVTLWSCILPVGFASVLILDAATSGRFMVADMLVLSGVLATLSGLVVVYAGLAQQSGEPSDSTAWYTLLWVSVLFASLWFVGYYATLFGDALALTISAITFAGLCYAVVNALLRFGVSFEKITPFIIAFLIPTIGLLPAFDYSSWDAGALSVNAVSLYVYITVLALLARTLFSYAVMRPKVAESARMFATVLTITASVFAFMLVWALSHVLATSAVIAVTVSLFVYTITGLILYVFGKRTNQVMYVRAGYTLLAAVVLRLGLFDVWGMEPFWRIVTFLGVGALFIIAALFERETDLSKPTNTIPKDAEDT